LDKVVDGVEVPGRLEGVAVSHCQVAPNPQDVNDSATPPARLI
jgi:hypothetical protein